ncbi:MAG: RHS repeat-associated core domain-containing protein [Actinomycetota bacterium]|nr:RHS repeat-associated core domain-containing protein [Actinomycetota bacterium]
MIDRGPHAVTGIGAGYSFDYDLNGNMTTRVTPEGTQTLDFDEDHQLELVTEGTTTTRFVYDADGNRVLRIIDNGEDLTGTIYVAGLYEYEEMLIPDPELMANPTSVSGEGTAGEPGYVWLGSVTVSAPGESAVPITVTPKSGWILALMDGSGDGKTPIAISISATPQSLSAGTEESWIDVTAAGYQDLRIPVTFLVNTAGLVAAPDDVTLNGTAGGDSVQTAVDLSTTDDSNATYTTEVDALSWLSVDPPDGATTVSGTTLTVTADPATLGAGTHQGTVTISANSYTTETIDVTFTVDEATPDIVEVQQKAITESYASDTISLTLDSAPTPGNLLVVVAASGAGGIHTDGDPNGYGPPDYEAARPGYYDTRAVWSKVAQPGDSSTITVRFTANEEHGLAVFEYSGLGNAVFDVGADESSDYTDVTALTTGTTPTTTDPYEIAIAFWNRWGPASTTTSYSNGFIEQVDLNYNGSHGFHVATKILTSTGAVESTMSDFSGSWTHSMVATFKADGAPPAPYLVAVPSLLPLTADQDGSAVSDDVSVTASDAPNVASYTVTDNQPWLSTDPDTGNTPGIVTITADPVTAGVGIHNGVVTVTAPGYDPVTIDVTFTVNLISGGGDITQVQVTDASDWTGTTVTATLPTTPTVANHMIAVVGSGAGLIHPPTGWNTLVEDEHSAAATGVYWRQVQSGDSGSVTFTFSESEEHFVTLFEYSGLANPPDDQSGSAQDSSGTNQSITVTADAANSQAVELNVVGAMSWNPETDITWGGYTEAVDQHNGAYMNYGAATKITAAVETASTTVDMDTGMQLFATIATFKADEGGGAQAATVSVTDQQVNVGLAGLFDRTNNNTAYQGALLRAEPDTVNATAAAYQTSGITVITETMYYVFGGQPMAMRRLIDNTDQGVEFLLWDHLGSTSVSHAADGTNTRRQYYNPWGRIRHSEPSDIASDVGYTGQRLDTSTDLMYYNARYYDPTIGRFISADTIVPNPANPQSFNRYSYVRNNPIKHNDPTGRTEAGGDCSNMRNWGQCLRNFGDWLDSAEENVEEVFEEHKEQISLVIDLTPIAGWIKNLAEIRTGTDLLTGGVVPSWALLLGAIPGGKWGSKLLGLSDEGSSIGSRIAKLDTSDVVAETAAGIITKGRWKHIVDEGKVHQYFGLDRAYSLTDAQITEFMDVIARISRNTRPIASHVRGSETFAYLGRLGDKKIAVQYYNGGELDGQLATVFIRLTRNQSDYYRSMIQ